jgi:hypothetical protein
MSDDLYVGRHDEVERLRAEIRDYARLHSERCLWLNDARADLAALRRIVETA